MMDKDLAMRKLRSIWDTYHTHIVLGVVVFLILLMGKSLVDKWIDGMRFQDMNMEAHSSSVGAANPGSAKIIQRMKVSPYYFCDEMQGGKNRFVCYSRTSSGEWVFAGAY